MLKLSEGEHNAHDLWSLRMVVHAKAVVIAADATAAGPELEAELLAYCRSRLAHYKCPVSVDFVEALPRPPTGKLLKRELRKQYWP